MHNFKTCLEKDNPDNSRRLQLLIQHCYGKARDAIESCANLPVDQGYYVAKSTLCENCQVDRMSRKDYFIWFADFLSVRRYN